MFCQFKPTNQDFIKVTLVFRQRIDNVFCLSANVYPFNFQSKVPFSLDKTSPECGSILSIEGSDELDGEIKDFLFSLSILFLRISNFLLTASKWSLTAALLMLAGSSQLFWLLLMCMLDQLGGSLDSLNTHKKSYGTIYLEVCNVKKYV